MKSCLILLFLIVALLLIVNKLITLNNVVHYVLKEKAFIKFVTLRLL